jgi:hypothetical protein
MDLQGLSFSPGVGVQAAIKSRFGEPVSCPARGCAEFILVASFGHCKFHLSEQSVGFLLQATIGGVVVDFRSQQLSEKVFKSVVHSCNVGFHVYNLRSFTCDQYKVFFYLWGNGGLHWTSEVKKYYQEEDDQWETISCNRNRNHSYASVLKGSARLSGANRVPIGLSKSHYHRNSGFPHRSAFDRL